MQPACRLHTLVCSLHTGVMQAAYAGMQPAYARMQVAYRRTQPAFDDSLLSTVVNNYSLVNSPWPTWPIGPWSKPSLFKKTI